MKKILLIFLILGILIPINLVLVAGDATKGRVVYTPPTSVSVSISTNNTINISRTNYWDDLDIINATQMEENSGVLNILETWLTTFWDKILGTKTTDDLTQGTTNLYDNQSWNQTKADTLYSDTNDTLLISQMNASWLSTYNATYDASVGNASWNQTKGDSLYAGIEWDYNQTLATYNLWNTDWISTYNVTYHSNIDTNETTRIYNMNDSWLSTYNATYHSNIDTNETTRIYDMNASWLLDTNETAQIFNMNTSWLSTYNATYAASVGNASWNQTKGDSLYIASELDPAWAGNYSIFTGLINNASYLSTYNASYMTNNTEGWILNFTKIYSLDWSNVSGITEIDPAWTGNYSIFLGLINNASYLSTYNATYHTNIDTNETTRIYDMNASWLLDTNETTQIFNMNDSWLSTYNATYHSNIDTNETTRIYNMNDSWYTTYNATYNLWAYNQTLATYNLWNTIWSADTNETTRIYDMNDTWVSTYNATYHNNIDTNETIRIYDMNDSWLSTYNATYASNYTNKSNFWDNYNTANATQMENSGGVLNILESWLTTFFNTLFGAKTTDDLTQGSTNLYDNQSWNQTKGDLLYSDTNETTRIYDMNASWLSTYNATYHANIDTNETTRIYDMNASWLSTYNATYDAYVDTNVTETEVEAYIFDEDNNAHFNMSGYNITGIDCLVFETGDSWCKA